MKRLILFELIILFLATTFESDSPPGWYQQILPRTDFFVNDIFFLDSSTGWLVTKNNTNDTAFVLKTTNGGNNWQTQFNLHGIFNAIQFLDVNTGYIAGDTGFGACLKTTNGGSNWNILINGGNQFIDLYFVNANTGWICDNINFGGAGLLKTTNGGLNWTQQLTNVSEPSRLFFINSDTGWTICQQTKILKTTDGGANWNQIYVFPAFTADVYFTNDLTGWASSDRFYKTSDGGFNWQQSISTFTGGEFSFVSDSIGWSGLNSLSINKTTNGGNIWFRQTTNISNPSVDAVDSVKAWAGGRGIVKTTDGGGPPVGIIQIGTEIPSEYKLFQNYPNPFNPVTNIGFRISGFGFVTIKIFDITGKEITTLVNKELQQGDYRADWNASAYSSGLYFYKLTVNNGKEVFTDTKKMMLIK